MKTPNLTFCANCVSSCGYQETVVESLFIGPCLAQLAGLVLQEGKRGLGAMECQLWGLTNPFLWTLSLFCWHSDVAVSSLAQPQQCLETAPVSPPEPCWGASGVNTRNCMREWPEHLPQFRDLCLQGEVLHSPFFLGSDTSFLWGRVLQEHPICCSGSAHMDLGVLSVGMGLSSRKGEHTWLLGGLSNAGIT